MRRTRPLLSGVASLLVGALVPVAPAAAEPLGTWLTEGGRSRVAVERCADRLCGTIVWVRDDLSKVDARNEDETLRNRPIVGIRLIAGFKADGDARWTGGTIYNPEDGRTYSAKMEISDPDTLKVSGCVLFICKAQLWTKVE